MMELMLKKPHKLPPLKIQGKHIAGMRSIDKNYPSKLKTKFKKERSEDKRQSLPSSFEADILDLTSKELTEKERVSRPFSSLDFDCKPAGEDQDSEESA